MDQQSVFDERIKEREAAEKSAKPTRKGWVGFVEGDVVNFMVQYELEKMTLDDGEGNKAKLTRLKDNAIKVECTSSNIV
ncbi:MAG: hypothetical protein LBS11_09530 [Oscillospiraceae bacterium]|jgi:hypothetical protein|nr:hypothetical protein [Oscillospiraceae bacterium]